MITVAPEPLVGLVCALREADGFVKWSVEHQVPDPRAMRKLSLDALEALVAKAASTLAVLQAALTAKLLDADPGIPGDQTADRLLTLAQAREQLQVRHLPPDLPRVRLSRKRVRVRLGDLRTYTEQHRVLGQQHVAPQVYNMYSTPYDGKRAAEDPYRAQAHAKGSRGPRRRDHHLARPLGARRGRHLRAGRPVGAGAGAATSPPSKGEVNGNDEEG